MSKIHSPYIPVLEHGDVVTKTDAGENNIVMSCIIVFVLCLMCYFN